MNQVQLAIARVAGLDQVFESQNDQLGELAVVQEHLIADNQMLQRTIEDLDYLNLFDISNINEVLPGLDRKQTIRRLRALRHDNPLAKQAVKLIVRFTLGRGVQWILSAEKPPISPPAPVELPADQQSTRGIVPIKFEDSSAPPPPAAKEAVGDPATIASYSEPPMPNPALHTITPVHHLASSADPLSDELPPDPIRDIIEEFWTDGENRMILTSHRAMQEMLDDVVTDGEKFFACFADTAPPYVKVTEIPLEEMNGIIYNPDNRVQPVLYRRTYQDMAYDGTNDRYVPNGDPKTRYYRDYRITDEQWKELAKTIKIPKAKLVQDAKVRHSYINPLWTKSGKRGISELYASREWFRVFREFMEGRAAINQAAQAISYKRKIKGGPTAVASFTGKFGGLKVGETAGDEIQKLSRPVPGATYDSNDAVDLEWMKTDTGAAGAAQDAKMLLSTGGAGVGTMAHYFGEGGDANLATAQSMELPMVKSYEDWQQWVEDEYTEWIRYVLTVAMPDNEDEVQDATTRLGFSFPPIISQDVVKQTTSWAQIVRDIAPNNMTVKREAIRGALIAMKVPNIDALMPEIEAQMAQAEQQRIDQANAMAAAIASGGAPVNPVTGKPTPPKSLNGHLPNEGLDPNTKHLVAGKGEKAANGPKSA